MSFDSRYTNVQKIFNNSEQYEELLKEKNLKTLVQYSLFKFDKLKNFKDYNLNSVTHQVQPHERLYQISQKYYNSPEYGWLILYTNRLQNELSIKEGTVLVIYFPLNILLGLV